jgi:serine/threonine protein kinase/Flp pilus assembly protein TadD
MRCPFCGTELGSGSRCSACKRSTSDVATGVLTPIPDAATVFHAPDHEDDSATIVAPAGAPAPDDSMTRLADVESPTMVTGGTNDDSVTTFEPPDGSTIVVQPPQTGGTGGKRAGGRVAETGPLTIGQAFGARYHIIRMLGIGGMGAVYQAWDAELGVSVAIKVIRPEAMADPVAAAEIERRFKRELILARQVTHKNVVRIHDIGDINGIKYITMPFVDGDDLSNIVKKAGRLPIATVLHVARSVVSGLVAAHAAGVVHRDLKPANIMVDSDGEAMIMDFGIARSTGGAPREATQWQGMSSKLKKSLPAFADATTYGAVVGTVEYMAPEQAKGQAVDQRADIYAFGLILYDLLLGRRRADRAISAIAELQGRMEKAPPPLRSLEPDIPEAVERIVMRCIEPDAEKRYATTVELEAELNRLDDKGELIPIPARFSKKMIAGAATLVLALVAGTWYFTRTPPPVKPHDPVTVLIADFENKTNDPTFDHTLEPMLKLALEGASFISAHDRTRIRAAFGMAPPEKLDEAAARQIAIKQAVGIVLSGSIDRKGAGYEVTVKAAEPVTGNAVADAKGSASSKEQVLGTVTKLATTVRKLLGDKTSESAQLFAMKSISTASLEVLGHYAAGVELQSKGKYEEARQAFLKAIALDPQFGLGYQGLASSSRNVGKLQDAEKYAKEALKSLDTMTERERFNVRGYYYRTIGDLQQCVSEYGQMLTRYSADTVAHNQRAICLAGLRNMSGAVDELRQAVRILPNHVTYRANLAILMTYAGDFAGAEREVQAMKEPVPRAMLALAYSQMGQGRLREAAETYSKLGTTGALGASFSAAGLGDLALYEGRFTDAVRTFEQGAAADLAAKNSDPAANKFASLAYVHLMRGQKDAAAAAAEKALANSKVMAYRFLAARVLVEAGPIARAQTLAADLASQLAAEPQAYGKIIEGEIALKKRNLPQAIKILIDANSVVDTWLGHFDLGRVYLEAGAFTQATSEFDICIKRRGETIALLNEDPTYGLFPPVYYYQGRAREGMQTAGFAASYQEYLKIRGNSTEDPLLPEVRKRAAK